MTKYSQAQIKSELPSHLRQFISEQDYSAYSPRDHAVWRYVMKQLIHHLKEHTHSAYLEGLKKSGINSESIPSIDEMNECLDKIGWKAVVVDGFIPPQIFMEFQTLKILTIAVDMRSYEHILYTPAPDIVHESAGHAPYIVDVDYSEFLQKFGEVGVKAMYTEKDFEIYEAIRHLSIIKEYPHTSVEEIKAAERDLERKLSENTEQSEAALLTRLHWWTVEYGLLGKSDDYVIFGAGLLSSLGESMNCLNDETVKKIPLTVNAVETAYDITTEQPQLFVTESCKHLSQVLDEFSTNMCYKKGGASSIQTAINSNVVCTAVYSTGVSVSGQFNRLRTDAMGNEIYIGTTGPTQLAYQEVEIDGHGIEYHIDGFGSPVGRLKNVFRAISECSIEELKHLGIEAEKDVQLDYLSGITVSGYLRKILRQDGKNILFSFDNCCVKDLDGTILFDPSWGSYDLSIGDRIVSVYAGSADKSKFEVFKQKSHEKPIAINYTDSEKKLFALYQELRDLRESDHFQESDLEKIYSALEPYPKDYLIRIELLELVLEIEAKSLEERLRYELDQLKTESTDFETLISLAYERLDSLKLEVS